MGIYEDLKLLRQILSRLIQVRTGLGDFVDYHKACQHENYDPYCSCRHEKTRERFV